MAYWKGGRPGLQPGARFSESRRVVNDAGRDTPSQSGRAKNIGSAGLLSEPLGHGPRDYSPTEPPGKACRTIMRGRSLPASFTTLRDSEIAHLVADRADRLSSMPSLMRNLREETNLRRPKGRGKPRKGTAQFDRRSSGTLVTCVIGTPLYRSRRLPQGQGETPGSFGCA